MIDAPLALAFTAGMVATVNPCGFAMLPAYLTFFLGLDAGAADEDARAGVARALAVGAVVTLGFVAVFTTIGALISHLSLAVDEWFPWMTIVVGLAVLALGIALLGGFELRLALPHLERGARERTLPSMFVFGVSYAVASLSCTLPVFLSVVAGTFSRSNTASGIAMYVCFALGMGLVLTVLTLALALPASRWSTGCARPCRSSTGSPAGSWSWPGPTSPGTASTSCASPTTPGPRRARSTR